MMEIYGTIHFKLILPHFPGFQQEPLPSSITEVKSSAGSMMIGCL